MAPRQDLGDIPYGQSIHPEVSEFMVRRLDGHILPVLDATPRSGIVYSGLSGKWVPELESKNDIDFAQIYSQCIQTQNSLIETANKLARKRKLPSLDTISVHTWTEVEESVQDACNILEGMADKDSQAKQGFTGNMRKAFRKLCHNAGAGVNLVNLVPSDNYLSVLCGGLKVIFMALQQTDHYRKDIYNALEDLPFILTDHAAMVELNRSDEELHRRVAALYTSLFKLMEAIFSWFLKGSLGGGPLFTEICTVGQAKHSELVRQYLQGNWAVCDVTQSPLLRVARTGARIFLNPSKFSEALKNSMDDVKQSVQRIDSYTNIIATKRQQNIEQQNYTLIHQQGQSVYVHSEQNRVILNEIKGLEKKLAVLENLSSFLDDSAEERLRQRAPRITRSQSMEQGQDIDALLHQYFYEPSLVTTDCEHLLQVPYQTGRDFDEDRVSAIKASAQFKDWIRRGDSSVLFVNANLDTPSSLEMSFVSAQAFERAMGIYSEEMDTGPKLIPLAFFCGQHEDHRRDENAHPSELAMSLLLQLVDRYRAFSPEHVAVAFDRFNPEDIGSILNAFSTLVSCLPEHMIVFIIIDGLRSFGRPKKRRNDMVEVVEGLADICRRQHPTTLKVLFANSTRAEYLEDIFTDDETLRVSASSLIEGGYNTRSWLRPVDLDSVGEYEHEHSGSW